MARGRVLPWERSHGRVSISRSGSRTGASPPSSTTRCEESTTMQPVLKRWRAALVAGVLLAAGAVSAPAYAATACEVDYTTNDWNTGFTATVTIHNLGDPLSSWNLGWTFPDSGQRVTQGWS